MRSRFLGDRVVVVLRRSIVHAGALKVVPRTDAMFMQHGARQRARLIPQGDERWRPGVRLAVRDIPSGCEYLAHSCAHRASRSEAAEQLEIHLWILPSLRPDADRYNG